VTAPRILLTNDDGIEAPGIERLAHALRGLGEIVVIAPARNHSGAGSALTVGKPIRLEPWPDGPDGEKRFAVHGTPADTMNLALRLPDVPKPLLVVSGINNGWNVGQNVRHSGTVGAAFEAASVGVPALAVSVDFAGPQEWSGAEAYTRRVAEKAIRMAAAGQRFLLNLNVPARKPDEIRGLKIVCHGTSGYVEGFMEQLEEGGVSAYGLSGGFRVADPHDGFDGRAVSEGWASLCPLMLDWTDHALREELESEEDW